MEEKLVEIIHSNGGEQVKITRLEDQRAEYIKQKLTPLLVVAGVGTFLFINVILGLFGVLWYSISQRVSEIGVRRAVGATATDISFQFVSEMLILASMGIVPGMIVAVQIQMLNLLKTEFGDYVLSMALTMVLIYALVSLCAAIPGIKSAKMNPAEALAEE
jgi:putative ABC transport system permease protein